jgi:glycosyltransferase involved in cell wall biosynthesis
MRVMRVITRLNIGGPSYQAIYLTERLQAPEFVSALVVGSVGPGEGSLEALAAERGVAFTRIPALGREISLRSDARTLIHLYRAIRRFRPDLVHTHLAKAGTLGRVAARLARVPAVVHTYHGHVFHSYFSPRKTALLLRIERALAHWTDRIIVLGKTQEREILEFGVGRPEQMTRIPLGLELEPFLRAGTHRGEFRRELGLPSQAPLVGIVARLVPIKAHSLFLQAARRVADARPETEFLVIGDGELRPALEQQARDLGFPVRAAAGVAGDTGTVGEPEAAAAGGTRQPASPPRSGAVHFTGFRADLPAIYADLDLVVLCSRNEGLPVTVIEALAAARPVVATEVGAVRDLVVPGETGCLVPAGDAAALAAAMLQQLADPERAAAMARAGQARVYPQLSVERLERDIRALYRELGKGEGVTG